MSTVLQEIEECTCKGRKIETEIGMEYYIKNRIINENDALLEMYVSMVNLNRASVKER